MTLLVIIYQTKISLHPIILENVQVSGIFIQSYCFSREGPGRSRYPMIYYLIGYCNTNIQNIHSSFLFPGTPYQRVPGNKKALVTIMMQVVPRSHHIIVHKSIAYPGDMVCVIFVKGLK